MDKENKAHFKATVADHYIYVETTTELVGKLFDHFIDNGYEITNLEEKTYYEALRNGEIVYQANTEEVVDEFIENNERAKEIKYGGKTS